MDLLSANHVNVNVNVSDTSHTNIIPDIKYNEPETTTSIPTTNSDIEPTDQPVEISCAELKNIKYKMRLMNPSNNVEVKTHNNSYANLQLFLDDEKNKNKLETWNKLNKSIKNKKIEEYVNKYIQDNKYELSDKEFMCIYLQSRINQGKLSKNKEVIYDKNTGIIKEIPGFLYNKHTKHVTIKNLDSKHVSTLKNLKTSLKII